MAAIDLMRNLCSIKSKSHSLDTAGGLAATVVTSVTSSRVMLDVTGSENYGAHGETAQLSGQAYFPYGTTLDNGDHFTMSDGQHSGITFAVQSVPTDEVGRQTHLVCEVASVLGSSNR